MGKRLPSLEEIAQNLGQVRAECLALPDVPVPSHQAMALSRVTDKHTCTRRRM